MSENNVFTETVHAPQPAVNPYDGTQEAYQASDNNQSLESVLEEKKQTEELRGKVEELEASEGSELEETEEVETEAKKQEDDFSSKFAALSRREKSLREKESAIDAKLAELEQRITSLQAPKEPEVAPEPAQLPLEYRLKRDPLGTLKELGLSYDELTNLALNDGKLSPEAQLDLMRQDIEQKYSGELQQLREELKAKEERLEEEKFNETVNNFKGELTNFVNDTDKYELIRANDAVEVIYDVIEQHYSDTGRILSKEEAADQVEEYFEQEVEKLLKLNKLKNKFGAPQTAPPVESPEPRQIQKAPTLSNAHSATASKPSRHLSRDQSVATAASLLKWNE